MFVIVSCRQCGRSCEPEIQFIEESEFDDPCTRPFEELSFEMCDVFAEVPCA